MGSGQARRGMRCRMPSPAEPRSIALLDKDNHKEEDEFHLEGEELDNEMTIEGEERLGRDMSCQEEIVLLKLEGKT